MNRIVSPLRKYIDAFSAGDADGADSSHALLMRMFGDLAWPLPAGICVLSALFLPSLLFANRSPRSSDVEIFSVISDSPVFAVVLYTILIGLAAPTNFATLIIGFRIRFLLASRICRESPGTTLIARRHFVDSLIGIGIVATSLIAASEVVYDFFYRTNGYTVADLRPELVIFPRLSRIEESLGTRFDLSDVWFAAMTMNFNRIVEVALFLTVSVGLLVGARTKLGGVFNAIAAVFAIACINALNGIVHTMFLYPFELKQASRGFMIDTLSFIDLIVNGLLLASILMAFRTRFISSPLAIEQDP